MSKQKDCDLLLMGECPGMTGFEMRNSDNRLFMVAEMIVASVIFQHGQRTKTAFIT